jgi:hypothetical protein
MSHEIREDRASLRRQALRHGVEAGRRAVELDQTEAVGKWPVGDPKSRSLSWLPRHLKPESDGDSGRSPMRGAVKCSRCLSSQRERAAHGQEEGSREEKPTKT